MYWFLIAMGASYLFYYYLVKPQLYWKFKNVVQGLPVPLFGDNFKLLFKLESSNEMIQNIYNRDKNARYVGCYQGTAPTLMMRDPDLIKQITVKNFDHFLDHRSLTDDVKEPVFNKNLFSLKGDEWREMRSTLSPTFTSSKMRSMFNLMEQSAKQYVQFYLDKKQGVYEYELKDSLTRYANDVIANCAFGVSVDSLKQPTNEFYMKGKELTNFNGFWNKLKFIMNLISPKVMDLLRIKFIGNTDFFKYLVRDTVEMREEQHIIRPDMINLLMEAKRGKLKYEESAENSKTSGFATVEESDVGKKQTLTKMQMTDETMAAQVVIFFFAGFDTISTMMAFLCYELALNPDIQQRLMEEVDETKRENPKLSYDVLNKMKYLDMVITENMRKNSPVVAIDRVCTKPYTIQPERPGEAPIHLKVGDLMWLPIAAIHHDEKYYSNPGKFDPERFSEDNKSNLKPYTYFPFGSGPRNCIGSRFALMECKSLIFHVLSYFEFTVTSKTVVPMKLSKDSFNPSVEGGLWVGLKQRNL